MNQLHDAAVRTSLEARLATLRADSERKWGTMTVDQMLWHVNLFLAASVGEGTLPADKPKMPPWLFRLLLLYMPWPKSSPTNSGARATERFDFAQQQARCRELIAKFVAKPIASTWPSDPTFGKVDGKFASRLQARHLDHHFAQFGA